MRFVTKIYRIVILLSLLIVSCMNTSQPTQNVPGSPTPDFSLQTNTPLVELPTVVTIPTATPYPILDPASANELVLQLLKDNSTCQLPCWWGIAPALTTLQDARAFLNSFSSIASTNSINNDDSGHINLDIPNGNGLLSTFIDYHSVDGSIDRLIVGISQLEQNENGGYDEVYGDSAFAEATQLLALSEILRSYGQPKEILISTYSLQPLGWPVVFDIQMFYPEHGFLVVYHSLMEFSRNGYIKGCPSKSNISIGLWEAEKYLLINDLPDYIRDNVSSLPLPSYLQVNEATDMSIQDFYNTFKDDEGALCLETPSSLWPFPGQ